MSTFSDHPLGNEAALDVTDLWRRVTENRSRQANEPDDILERLEENGLTSPLYNGESYRNHQLLALAQLFLNSKLKVPDRLLRAVRDAIAVEIHPDVLAEWTCTDLRASSLRELCQKL